ncbi:PEP-CTERM/exosortase system-associated acyltransferase [Neptunicella marina]|uniref:PEP-CTERM/exosortase system-associated acyltransferase n=1 Tax=Neptunicella marina TaxID=2125989 RepID=A0A8J6M2N7_9ALTE|nr:PEP-CTERM/exosortase system-associated acyltransferase [Neptunicella marina]MBC3766523.1 PEP-CTERM/exosortase system-associated acyltransferase [Neptunicella marina]
MARNLESNFMHADNNLVSLDTKKSTRTLPVVENQHLRRFFDFFQLETGFNFNCSPQLCQDVFHLRYRVYCEALGFEPASESSMEKDLYDRRSDYFSVAHYETESTIGCCRVVKSEAQNQLLPVEELGQAALFEGELHPLNFTRDSICEISRLTVEEQFNCHQPGVPEQEYKTYPYIRLYLIFSALQHAASLGRPHVFTLCEPKFIRYLRIIGINMQRIGSYVSHKGLRQPCYINASEFMQNLPEQFAQMLERIEQHNLQSVKEQAIA